MASNTSDAAQAAYDADRESQALSEAFQKAKGISTSFTEQCQSSKLSPTVSVDLEAGSYEQPLFVFSLLVELDDDLDVDEYPMEQLEELRSGLRASVAGTAVDEWDWIVTTGTKAGSARQ